MSERHVPERREGILAAAEKLFSASGFAETTMDAVAEEAGIAKGSVYNYFGSKHELFLEVFARYACNAQSDSERLLTGNIPAQGKLDSLLDYWADRLGHYKQIGRLVLEFWATAARQDQEGPLARAFQEMYARWRGLVAEILSEGVASGEFRPQLDTAAAASLIIAILDGITIQSIMDMGLKVDATFLAALRRAIMLGLTAAEGPAEAESS